MIGPLGFAVRNLRQRGFHALLAFIGLTLTVASSTFLLLLGQGLVSRLGIDLTGRSTLGMSWLFLSYLVLSLGLIIIVGVVSTTYLVSSMINQRIKDIGVMKAAGSLPDRLFVYAFAEAGLMILSSCLTGAVAALILYVSWSWPTPALLSPAGSVPSAGALILISVPITSLLLSVLVARYEVGKIASSSTVEAISARLSNLNLKNLGTPLRIRKFGPAFNLAAKTVLRDRELNKTLVRVSVCVFLTMVVLGGALVSADTSRSYVERAVPANVLVLANYAMYNQYVKLGTAFSNTALIPSLNYTNPSYMIAPQLATSLRAIPGVDRVDTRLITMSGISGYVKAHLAGNQSSDESFNNQIIPPMYTGSTQALIVGIDPNNAIGDWFSSNGFLEAGDPQNTMVAGDSLVGNIVQMPFSLAAIKTLGSTYNVKSAVVDPLNAGRVLYAPVQSLQATLGVSGYNVLLARYNQDPRTLGNITQFATANNLVAASLNVLLNTDLAFLNNTWTYLFTLPILTLALTCGVLLSYLTTTFSRRFNDYIVLKVLGAKNWFRLKLLFWEAWGLLAICMLIAIPLALLVTLIFLVPDPSISAGDAELSVVLAATTLTAVSIASTIIYSKRLKVVTVKDLRL